MAIGPSLLSACVGGSEPASTVTPAAKIVTPAPTSAKGSATVGVAGTRTRIATPYTSPIIASPVAASPVMASPATAKASSISTAPVNVAIVLTDYRVSAFQRSFKVGQPYRFEVENNGAVLHQFVIEARGATDAPLSSGAATALLATIAPGATADSRWTFANPIGVQFASYAVGDAKQGMVLATVNVVP